MLYVSSYDLVHIYVTQRCLSCFKYVYSFQFFQFFDFKLAMESKINCFSEPE